MDEAQKPTTVEELKIKGNECVKDGKFIEAVLHYTQAIKMDPNNYILHSNRSFAFLKLDQHYLSLQDANETVRLQPQWAKGYFRRAEVEAASGLYDEAIISYTHALQLDPQNQKLIDSIKELSEMQENRIKESQNVVWICTCIGLVVGIMIVILDYSFTTNPTLTNPLSMVAFSMALSGLGFVVGKTTTMMSSWSAGRSLQPPVDLGYNDSSQEKEDVIPERKNKYSKAQARQRYKQGKL
ncbi:hsp70-Hsp90 organizing protein 3-like [Bombyx mandarina]|uniref:Hsp70-Hsp90 organizing protein 3-like n=1 Tax=Bombyx mandarina TaxID=7092 RepID=A0A6J2JB57_BOMMA|nr:hsp70-Hsp90 organizing protein 3-like [Bombyx mandarina]